MHGESIRAGASVRRPRPTKVDNLGVRDLQAASQLRIRAVMHPGVGEILTRTLLLPNGVPILSAVQPNPLPSYLGHEVVG